MTQTPCSLAWPVVRLKWLAGLRAGDAITAESIAPEGDYPVYGGNGLRGYTDGYTHDGEYVLIGRQGALCGNINYARGKFWASEHAVVAAPRIPLDSRWFGELLRSLNLNQYSVSAAQPGLAVERIADLMVLLPPLHTQRAIGRFLDRETARIDALIEKKTRFIELLREKRKALITQAVTQGLDLAVPMKDSGVDWLGQVPAHWQVKPLKLLVKPGSSVTYGIVQPGDALDEGVPFIQTTNMTSGDLAVEQLQKTSPAIEAAYPRSRLVGGEVVLGIRASIGAAHLVPPDLAGANLSRGVARIDCSGELLPAYLLQYLRSRAVDSYWDLSKQGSTFNEVSIATVREMPVPLPPTKEQTAIVNATSSESSRIGKLIELTRQSTELLVERRSALITAAVTGQIDLRDAA